MLPTSPCERSAIRLHARVDQLLPAIVAEHVAYSLAGRRGSVSICLHACENPCCASDRHKGMPIVGRFRIRPCSGRRGAVETIDENARQASPPPAPVPPASGSPSFLRTARGFQPGGAIIRCPPPSAPQRPGNRVSRPLLIRNPENPLPHRAKRSSSSGTRVRAALQVNHLPMCRARPPSRGCCGLRDARITRQVFLLTCCARVCLNMPERQ